jgi:methanol metabolism-related c-type cytochrome
MPKPYVAVFMLALVWNAIPSAGAQTQQSEEKPYKINNGVTDWYTFSGYKRYHSECHVCHGPDGLGSSFAPSLVDSLKTMTYDQFLETVTNGKTEVSVSSQKKMPAFGTNPNVMCFIDDIYAYLKARADRALERGRPQHVDKPEEAKTRDDSCLGST